MSRELSDAVALAKDDLDKPKPHWPWPFADRVAQFKPASIEPGKMAKIPTVWATKGRREWGFPQWTAFWFTIGALIGLAIAVGLFVVGRS